MVCARNPFNQNLTGVMAKLIAHGANVSAENKVIEKFIRCTKPGFMHCHLNMFIKY